jgi:hypothetical protein
LVKSLVTAGGKLLVKGGATLLTKEAVTAGEKELVKEGAEFAAKEGTGAVAKEGTAAVAQEGVKELPKFTQTTASIAFKNGPFAGKTIGEVAAGLRSGAINPSQLPVDVIIRNGQMLALNTRSALALLRGGIDASKWTIINRTGDAFFEKLLTERLARNGLSELGTEVLRISGAGKNASAIW